MERNNLSNTSIEKRKCKELRIDIDERLKPAPECCVYRVPQDLRKINAVAYTPQLISIGPFHHGKKELLEMEKQKVRYKREFAERFQINEEKWESLITFIKDNEQKIRDCYAETCRLQSLEFITMVLYDAIFIIEFLLKVCYQQESEFLVDNSSLLESIGQDLLLLENQLPLFVLEKLYNLAFASWTGEVLSPPPFIALACKFCKCSNQVATESGSKHFLDLRRNDLVRNYPFSTKSRGELSDLPTAVKLHESGVKFKNLTDNCLPDIKFKKRKGCLPCFNVNELQIPHITIEDGTECLFRNIMALELCHYPFETYFCNYIDLMYQLIDTEKDVNMLVDYGIISNYAGDHATIAKMFKKLCRQIATSDSCYKDMCEELKEHHGKWWNRTMGTLRSVYFNNLWRGTGTIAAAVLLVLTFLQTIYTMRT